jgi:tetratricopeptide (TPR) repeat protein
MTQTIHISDIFHGTMRKKLFVNVVCFTVIIPCFGQETSAVLPATTKSPEALRAYREGVQLEGNLHTSEALKKYKLAVKADPNFALAWAMIATTEASPAAAARARQRAHDLMPRASAGEQLMIKWVVSRGDADMINAIAAGNDLVAAFPKDKYVLFTVGAWLMGLNQLDRAIALEEQSLAIDPSYAPALNESAYLYAYQRKFELAVTAMKQYAQVIPNEPNPQDSYAEILRLAGHYEDALTHYQEALKIMPSFASSQQGLGDTYALMGDQQRARAEYAKCSGGDVDLQYSILCRQMSAYSYIREKKYDEARKQLEAFVTSMHKENQTSYAVEAAIALSYLDKDVVSAFSDLDRAILDLRHDRAIPKAQRDEVLARIMAHKIRIAGLAGDNALAQRSLNELDAFKMSADPLIQAAWNGGQGAWLYSQKKYDEAISALQDDQNNPFSEMLLINAYVATGNNKAASDLKESLLTLRKLDIDLWMVQQELKK